MTGEVLVDTYTSDQRSSSPVSSDGDAVNTPEARVYFGPLQDAERKYAQLAHVGEATPVRRSNRLSAMPFMSQTTASSSDGEVDESGQDSDASAAPDAPVEPAAVTPPLQDDAAEEPSSALATKVMQAWDNPSPPPSPSASPPTPSAERDAEDIPIMNVDDTNKDPDHEMTDIQAEDASVPPTLLPTLDIPVPSAPEAQDDLIDFNSFSTTIPPPILTVVAPSAPTTPTRAVPTSATVDDLLVISPSVQKIARPLIEPENQSGSGDSVSASVVLSRTSNPSLEVAHADQTQLSHTFNVFLSVGAITEHEAVAIQAEEAMMPDCTPLELRPGEVTTTTPLRRSSRPRRSVSPYIASSPRPSHPRSPPPTDAQTTQNIVGPARRKSLKGKQRAIDRDDSRDGSQEIDCDPAGNPVGSRQVGSGSLDEPTVTPSIPPPEPDVLPERVAYSLHIDASSEHGSADGTRDGTSIEQEPKASYALNGRPGRDETEVVRLRPLSPTSQGLLAELLTASRVHHSTHDFPDDVRDNLEPHDTNNPRVQTATPPTALPTPDLSTEDPLLLPPSTPPRDVSPTPALLRTPARRIPIGQAVAQGMVSPQKIGSQFPFQHGDSLAGIVGTPLFKARGPGDAGRTPAKRVLITETRPLSPVKLPPAPDRPEHDASARRRQPSAEPTVPKAGPSFLAKPHVAQPSTTHPSTRLPFPIVASKIAKPEPHAPDGAKASSSRTPTKEAFEQQLTKSTATPSTLRQPTVRPHSKIPRVGKPYTRPAPALTGAGLKKASTTPRVAPSGSIPAATARKKVEPQANHTAGHTASTTRPVRLRKVLSTKPIVVDSDDSDDQPFGAEAGPGPKTVANRAAAHPAPTDAVSSPSLKRKRDAPPSDSLFSSPGTRPVVLLRRVVTHGKAATQENAHKAPSTPAPAVKPSPAPKPRASPARRAATPIKSSQAAAPPVPRIQMRKVVDSKKSKASAALDAQPDSSPSSHPAHSQPQSKHTAVGPSKTASPITIPTSRSHEDVIPPLTDKDAPTPSSPAPVEAPQVHSEFDAQEADIADPSQSTARSSTPPPPDIDAGRDRGPEAQGLRRTSRARKPTQAGVDVFGPVRATQRRKTAILGPPDTSVFSGMSVLALKTLTNNNTLRNQKQVADLETEVVMMDGKRPDSPTTKVRTKLDQEREAKAQAREDRAARRARRSEAATESAVDDMADEDSVMTDVGPLATGDGEPLQHRRGPGDEEDYVTPERPNRDRYEDGVVDKRVKWYKNLEEDGANVDDTPHKSRRPPRDRDIGRKGCLAPSAKLFHLDNMGNALNAEEPVPDLIVEHVVVKKFVYEDDELPEPESPPSPAKSTRSKTKKRRASS